MKYEVKLHIYDISNGWMRCISPILMCRRIKGLWHTGICIYDREYYYGGGIQKGDSEYIEDMVGKPVEVLSLGFTELDESIFEEFLDSIKGKYDYSNYNLFTQNCNHFTNEAVEFLTGSGIPQHIVNLPDVCSSTFVGKLVKIFLEKLELIGKRIDGLNDD